MLGAQATIRPQGLKWAFEACHRNLAQTWVNRTVVGCCFGFHGIICAKVGRPFVTTKKV